MRVPSEPPMQRSLRPQDPPAGSDAAWEEVDLHGLRPEQALRRLEQALHAARVRGSTSLLVITGRGWGNDRNEPVLRERMAAWLRSALGRSYGVRDVTVAAKGGALLVRLG